MDPSEWRVWEELANSNRSIEEDFAAMADALGASLKRAARIIDIAAEAQGFSKWLSDLLRKGEPNPKMKALFLGLGERARKSFQSHSVGKIFFCYALGGDSLQTAGRDGEVGDWRPVGEWVLESGEDGFWDSAGDGDEDWILMLGVAIICARVYFRGEGQIEMAKAALHGIEVGIGFPDGDLCEISAKS